MREILFRGKRIMNDEWVEGYYSKYSYERGQGDFICDADFDYTVYPESVGQFTGCTDKNGKRIFEGDIVKFGDIIGIINYNTGCYCVKTNKPDWRSRNNPAIDIIMNEYPNEMEIIGNIHDNPELLK